MFLSISIDLAGSTAAKSEIARLCPQPERCVDRVRDLYRAFLAQEVYFHVLLDHYGFSLDQIFVVKAIGDEVWIVVDVSNDLRPHELNDYIGRFFSAAMPLAGRRVHAFASEHDPEEDLDGLAPHEAYGRIWRDELPLKIFADLIDDRTCLESNRERQAAFEHRAGELMRDVGTAERARQIIDRLAGGITIEGRVGYRSDFIGPEVDRFFRCGKLALPALLTCGSQLIERISYDEIDGPTIGRPPAESGRAVLTGLPTPLGSDGQSRSYDYFYMTREDIQPSDSRFKGVLEPYSVFYVIPREQGLWPTVWPKPAASLHTTAKRMAEWGLLIEGPEGFWPNPERTA
jgi:hypothetical protein